MTWRIEQVKAGGNQKADVALRGDIEVPDRKLQDDMLHEGDKEERWLIAERDIPITDAMRNDAGALHGRKDIRKVPLIWAVRLDSPEHSTGKFWAFFPTDTRRGDAAGGSSGQGLQLRRRRALPLKHPQR